MSELVREHVDGPLAEIVLNDSARRNALGTAMFDGLEAAIARLSTVEAVHVILLRGEGAAFCAGFDLTAAVERAELMAEFVSRLSRVNRLLRRMPQVVTAAVQGAAIAGGCAILSACDFVFVAADAKLGYPVHRIGVSPAVTIPTLQQAIGPGAIRALLMGGDLIDGAAARRLGLATHIAASGATVVEDARAFCRLLTTKGPQALRITKSWLNELDGSLDDSAFESAMMASAGASCTVEAAQMLAGWNSPCSGGPG